LACNSPPSDLGPSAPTVKAQTPFLVAIGITKLYTGGKVKLLTRAMTLALVALLASLYVAYLAPPSTAVPKCDDPNPPPACDPDIGDQIDRLPVGYLDTIIPTRGGLKVQGWAIDPDTVAPIRVRVSVDGGSEAEHLADLSRPDVAKVYPSYGDKHGFDIMVPVHKGQHLICIRMRDATADVFRAQRLRCERAQMPGRPATPSDIDIWSSASGNYIVWRDNADDEDGYRVERASTELGPWTQISQRGPVPLTSQGEFKFIGVPDDDLKPNMRWCYRVTAWNVWGSNSILSCTVTSSPPLRKPSGASVEQAGSTTAILKWVDNSTTEDRFLVVIFRSDDQNRTRIDDRGVGLHVGTGAVHYRLNGLEPNTTYCFEIAAQKVGYDDAFASPICTRTKR
jgi:hypothetical protein